MDSNSPTWHQRLELKKHCLYWLSNYKIGGRNIIFMYLWNCCCTSVVYLDGWQMISIAIVIDANNLTIEFTSFTWFYFRMLHDVTGIKLFPKYDSRIYDLILKQLRLKLYRNTTTSTRIPCFLQREQLLKLLYICI